MRKQTEVRRARRTIRREWEAAGRPPCPVCATEFEADDDGHASVLWRTVVRPFCVHAIVGGQSPWHIVHDPCPLYPDCPIQLRGRPGDPCVCPRLAVINLIVLARRFGERTVRIPTARCAGAQRAAYAAGLEQHHYGMPLCEIPWFDPLRSLPSNLDESFWDRRMNVIVPPEYLVVDVDRTICAGRVVAAAEQREVSA